MYFYHAQICTSKVTSIFQATVKVQLKLRIRHRTGRRVNFNFNFCSTVRARTDTGTYVRDTGTYVLDTSSIRTSTQVGTKYRTAVQLQL